jgi:hypothetical protein
MTQSKIKVHAHAEPTDLDMRHGSSVSGCLYIEVDGFCFPTKGWYDYVSPVLCWWMDNSLRLYASGLEVKNSCMDGSYTFFMRRAAQSDEVALRLHDGARTTMGEYIISYKRYLAGLRGAAKGVLNELEDLGLQDSAAVSGLRQCLDHVRRLESEIAASGLP